MSEGWRSVSATGDAEDEVEPGSPQPYPRVEEVEEPESEEAVVQPHSPPVPPPFSQSLASVTPTSPAFHFSSPALAEPYAAAHVIGEEDAVHHRFADLGEEDDEGAPPLYQEVEARQATAPRGLADAVKAQRWSGDGGEEEGEKDDATAAASLPSWASSASSSSSSSSSISASLPLPLLVSSVMAAAPASPSSSSSSSALPSISAYSAHRPEAIATSNLHQPLPSSLASLDALELAAPAHLPHLPQPPGEQPHSQDGGLSATAAAPLNEEVTPGLRVHGLEEDDEEDKAADWQGGAAHATPAVAAAAQQPYRYGGGVYVDDEEEEEEEAKGEVDEQLVGGVGGLRIVDGLDGSGRASIGDTTVQYSSYALPRAGLPLQSTALGSTTAPSSRPYSTASSLALLPTDAINPLSPSAHSTATATATLLRPSSALSYSPQHVSLQQDDRGTMQSAASVLSYDRGGEDDEVGRTQVEGYEAGELGEVEGAYSGYQRTASYQYDDPAEVKEGEGEGGEGVAALVGLREEKERGDDDDDDAGGVVRVDVDDYPAVAASEIELQRASSGLADRWQPAAGAVVVAHTVEVEDAPPVFAGLVVAPSSGFAVDENENPEGRSAAVSAQRPSSARRGGKGSAQRKAGQPRVRATERSRMQHWPLFTSAILVLDVVYFVAMLSWSGWSFASMLDNPLYGPDGDSLLHFGARFTPAILLHGEHWRFIVSCIVHCGVIHIIFSLCVGGLYCWTLEQEYGWYRVLPVWAAAGVFSQMFASLLSPDLISVGGGAALAGVAASWLADFVHTHERISGKWQYFARNLVTFCVVFVSGIFPFVDNWALGSGALMGFLLGLVMYAPVHRTVEGRWKVHNLPVVIPALLLVVAAMVVVPVVLLHQSEDAAYSSRGNAHWVACVDTSYWSCHSGVPTDCYNSDGLFMPGSSNTTDSGSAYSGYC